MIPEVVAVFKIRLTPGTPEGEEAIALMREHTIETLKLRARMNSGKDNGPTEEERESFTERRERLKKALQKCFADNPVELFDLQWNTLHYITREHEATILAPAG